MPKEQGCTGAHPGGGQVPDSLNHADPRGRLRDLRDVPGHRADVAPGPERSEAEAVFDMMETIARLIEELGALVVAARIARLSDSRDRPLRRWFSQTQPG
jgi:hypothetical protein